MSEPLPGSNETVPMIAVVGLAGRFPGARTVAELWRNLCGGVESVSSFTVEELAAAGIDPRLLSDSRYVRAKGVLADADLFDAAFFGFTPREAEQMDPQHRVFLECAWEALEDAGCDPQRFPGRAGVYAGCAANTYLIFNLLPHRELMEKTGVLQLLLLNDRDFLATRVSYKLDLKGPSVAVQTACSTSLVAIHMACQALLTGECDLALAGGVSISTPLVSGYLYQEGSVLSPDGRCRAFDAAAAGAVEGNGCGVVALKRLADALEDGDAIRAVVRGSAVTNDGASRVGFTAPSVDGQAAAISEALLISGVHPDTIGYVEAHGSGTPLGDPIEIEALTQAFRRAGARSAPGMGSCAIGSAKTNLGHCNAAAGVAGFLKAVLALEHRTLPPSLHFERPNPQIDFAASPFRVSTTCAPWEATDAPRRAGVSAFGLGGTNAHVVLEEAPAQEPSAPPSRPAQLLVLSARTPEALDAATIRLAEHLEARQDLESSDLADIAWTLQTGRRGLEHRRFVVARNRETAVAALRGSVGTAPVRCEEPGRRSVVFLFPGLGDQSVDMARGLYETEPVFHEQVDLCAGRLRGDLGCDLREVLFSPGAWSRPSPPARSGPDLRALLRRDDTAESPAAARLRQTVFAQPACFVVEYALACLLMHWGVEPRAMIGYSLGEYVAACLAGVLSLDDALFLVARRAKLIQDLPSGAMLAVPLAEEEVRCLLEGLDERLSLCATNGPHFCVVGGPEEAVGELERELAGRGASCLRLRTTHAFHSAMMEPVAAALTAMAGTVETRPPRIPCLSNVTGTWITEGDVADPAYWARHMCGTVRFAEGLGELLRESGRVYVEVGPGATLGTLVRQHPDAGAGLSTVPTLGSAEDPGSDLDGLLAAVGRLWAAGVEIDWERFHGGERRRRVPLPTYPFERRRFWIDPPAPSDPLMVSGAAGRAEPGAAAGSLPAPTPAPALAQRPGLSTAYVAPRNEVEESLVAIWQELFGIAPIGVEDSFLELGGQSLLAIQMMTQVHASLGVPLTVGALFEAPTVAGLAAEVARARGEETPEDLEELLAQVEGLSPEEVERRLASLPAAPPQTPQPLQPPPVARRSGSAGTGDWPLSFDQERLLQLHLDDPEMVSWNVDAGSRVLGPLDVPALLAAFAAVVRRHAAWRATFPVVDGRRVQRVVPWLAPETSLIDLTALPAELREPSAHQALRERTRAVFDLERGPLVRITLARIAGREHLCQLTVHHLATDWITFQHCWREVLAFYEAHRAGRIRRIPELPPLPAQYPDYVLWEREWLRGEVLEEHAGFWRRELAGFPLALELPTDRPRPPVHRQRGGLYRVRAGAPRTDRLRELGRREGATMFMTVLAVVNALLHRFSGLEKIVLGSNSANRARPELEPVFGFFLTQVPFAADLAGDPSFRELLGRVRRSALSSYAHQNFPFSKLIEVLRPAPDPSRSPVVQALVLVLEGQSRLHAGDLDFHPVPLFDGNSRWDLMFGLYDYRDLGLSGPLEYNADVFEAATIGRLLELFYRLIDAVTEEPGLRLSQLPNLSETAERQALVEWKGADRPRVEDLLARLAALRADGDPEAAIACGEETVGYADLESRAERIVDLLRRLGVWPGTRVALLLAPSPELAAVALAVWKAGGVCVPLDPAEPAVRLGAALADAELGLLVHRGPLPSGLAVTGAARLDVQDLLAPLPVSREIAAPHAVQAPPGLPEDPP